MARCPKLDSESTGGILFGSYEYICELTGVKMDKDDTKVKHLCNADSGYEYENCPIYKDR